MDKRKPYIHEMFYLKKDGSLGKQFSEIKTKVKFREYMISYFWSSATKEVVFRLKGEEIFRQVHGYIDCRSNASICFTRWEDPKEKKSKGIEELVYSPKQKNDSSKKKHQNKDDGVF